MDKNFPNSSFLESNTLDGLNNFRKKINNMLKENKNKPENPSENFNLENKEKNYKSNNLSIKTNKDTRSTESIEILRELGNNFYKEKFYNYSKSPMNCKKNFFKPESEVLDLCNKKQFYINNHYHKTNFVQMNLNENENIESILQEKILNISENTRY